MERKNLTGALNAARQEQERQAAQAAANAAAAERQRQLNAPRLEAERQEKIRISSERAAEFVAIMQANNIPAIGYHATRRVLVKEAGTDRFRDNSPRGYYEVPRFAQYADEPVEEPAFLGWIAIKSTTSPSYMDYGVPEINPGIFISEAGQTYPCSTLYRHGDMEYVTAGHYQSERGYGSRTSSYAPFAEPDPTLLADDATVDKMVTLFKERGIV